MTAITAPVFEDLLQDVGRKELRGLNAMATQDSREDFDLRTLISSLIRAGIDVDAVSRDGGVLVRDDYIDGYIKDVTDNVFGILRHTMAFEFVDWVKYTTHLVEESEAYAKVTVTQGRFAGTWFIRY